MRYSKRYIFFTIFLFVFILAKFNNSTSEFVEVEQFRGARLQSADWNPLIAASVNDDLITLNILSDLKGDENTVVAGAKEFNDEMASLEEEKTKKESEEKSHETE